ncbi:Hsp20/alpha crystallin family protein [Allochromatium palmeri]|uniref:SHSP domain-containing protein n=1 Tax=Allochromatium palmeri TaxID=231048 RepID=A0A6N8E8K5_9GAMM|nr:Hsp20/alpha crystallin family protein [Allochromatium palmeri]MTW19871.1 hypothetical protein [Allochromatium palmeri]
MRRITLSAVALSALLPTLAFAQVWTPYGYGPQAPGAVGPVPDAGYPGAYGPPAPPAFWSPDATERMARHARPAWPRLSLTRRATDDAYLIEIQLQNIEPNQVEIRPVGRGLVITHSATVRFSQNDALPGGEGYQSRYSISRDTSGRRVGLPPDADLAGMTREVEDGRILIRVPRVANDAWRGRW